LKKLRVLLDTHVLLWALVTPRQLSKEIRGILEAADNEVMFSAASIWEIAIKSGLRRMNFRVTPDEIAEAATTSGFAELPVRATAAAYVAKLPAHHRDPFDRLLIAQAITEPAVLYTADSQLEPYSELVRRI
jgi:PIN domain nuclease of toxin-antitoxin system